ncbi:MAG TPA: DUF4340 domain-containing protein [Candidatus Cloacimonadota bacterium]|nr:DUF4340 domain-containing protein [Candidatus Cloacimonadota bacterium]
MNKKTLIAGLVLLLLVGIFFLLKNRDSTEKLSRVFNADSTAIARIELIDPADTLVIAKTGSDWRLEVPVNWEANPQTVERLFNNVINAEYSKTVMTTSKDAASRYKLVPGTALQIKTFDSKGKLRDHVYFGNIGNPYDYFRYEGSSEIYQLKKLISNTFNSSLEQWRSPVVIRVSESEIGSIEVKYSQGSHVLTHKDKDWWFKDAANDFKIPLENRAIIRTVNILNKLDTFVFYDDPAPELLAVFKQPMATVLIKLKDGKSRKLVFAETANKEYLLLMDDNPKTLYGLVKDSVLRFTVNSEHYKELPYIAPPQQ